jgi:hypothetical protein
MEGDLRCSGAFTRPDSAAETDVEQPTSACRIQRRYFARFNLLQVSLTIRQLEKNGDEDCRCLSSRRTAADAVA